MRPVVRAAIRIATVAAVVAGSVAHAFTPQAKPVTPAQVAGKWQVSLEMEVGTASVVMVFKQEGEKLSGTYTGRYGAYPLVGTVKDRTLDFVVTINAEGTETLMHFVGDLADGGDVIKGSADLGGMGAAGWVAKIQK